MRILLRLSNSNCTTASRQNYLYTLSTNYLNDRINELVRDGNIDDARKLFDAYPRSRNTSSWNSLINGYIKTRRLSHAHNLFDQMPHRDAVSWTTLLTGFRDAHDPYNAHLCFLQMLRHSRPTELTFAVLLSAFSNTKEFCVLVPQLHGLVIPLGLDLNIYLGSALMRGYIGLGDRGSFCRVSDEILNKNVVTGNVVLLGYMEFGMIDEAKKAFDLMLKRNAFSWSTMINGYMKNGMVSEAREVFERRRRRGDDMDVVSWTAMMRGCIRHEKFSEALNLFPLMMNSGTLIRPNQYTFSCALDACAGCSSLVAGRQVHACILKVGIHLDVVLATSLVDMYGKCGDLDAAFCVFGGMGTKNLVSWNSIIGGCARHGVAGRALAEFERMVRRGVVPDEITFINVLGACVHGGLVKEGEEVFKSMSGKYGVEPQMEHYSCMVDLYGRAGQLEKAVEVIKGMPFEPDEVVWVTLISGCCRLYSSPGIRKLLLEQQQHHPAAVAMLLLSKIHSEIGIGAALVQTLKLKLPAAAARKHKAGSWID
ncbi:pentatricopeptide repeat-containing protein At2g21090-like [Andrographis paniculata]|uniref:pentatricopeptide repeat-containing protein At2g21090-like n=1 Tax=Andrographis paniculata TaxID=175694 RepID=UPI0021E80645|nr:pentatricopeptide repeat-containing protein At2g21090-like [Andrographis paniculata]